MPPWPLLLLLALLLPAPPARAEPGLLVDLADLPDEAGGLLRLHGSTGSGSAGVPVAGGLDCDGDGLGDYAMASMRASPLGRSGAGIVYLALGDGSVRGHLDTAVPQPRILAIYGDGPSEATGSELWMDDVTGDGVGDLLIARQNLSPPGRIGAGGLTVLVGGPELRAFAEGLAPLDLRDPHPSLRLTTLVGAAPFQRLGIWMRTGDVTGDGIADIAVGADQTGTPAEPHHGAVWVVRGGPHLARGGVIDLAEPGGTPLVGHLARVLPPPGSRHHHFGATCQVADLDGNGRAELLAAATLNRAGAALRAAGAPPGQAHARGGSAHGTLYIAWDDNFPGEPWPPGFSFGMDAPPGRRSIVDGGLRNRNFGEEILGGLDYDADGAADLFVGDIVGDGTLAQDRPGSGSGHVFYDAAGLAGLAFDLDAPPPGLLTTTILGAAPGDIASDTAAHGDFDGDGIADLAASAPHASPPGRPDAGILYVFHGRPGPWPALVDLAPGSLPPAEELWTAVLYGANGRSGFDAGDMLAYSAAAGDLDGDGRIDIVTNEMLGNGLAPGAIDVGNLIVLGGELLTRDDVEIDVRPGDPHDRIPLTPQRLVEVAILSSATVDPWSIDPATLGFGPDRAPALDPPGGSRGGRAQRLDANRDGVPDRRVYFEARATGLAPGDTEACLVGKLEGQTFWSCAAVRVPERPVVPERPAGPRRR